MINKDDVSFQTAIRKQLSKVGTELSVIFYLEQQGCQMGLDLRTKSKVLKDQEQIFRSCQIKFVQPSCRKNSALTATKFENYNALYLEIQRYCKELLDQIWFQYFKNADIHSKYDKLPVLKYTDFSVETKLTSSFKQSCIRHAQGIFSSFIEGHNFALARNDEELLRKKSKKPEINEFEIPYVWADVKINSGLCFVQINGCGEYGVRRVVGENPNSKFRPRSYGDVLRLPFKFSKYHRSKFSGWELAAPTLCRDGIKLNFSKLIPRRLKQKQNSKAKEFVPGQVGCDQGINSVITLAYKKDDKICSFQSPSKDKQGWTLSKIIKRLQRCRRGSKQHARYQKLRASFIRWSINQARSFIKENRVKVIALEDIRFMGKGSNSGSFLSKFEHSLIRSKLNSLCEDCGASLLLQTNAYRSQRCSKCGYTHRGNRKKGSKQFVCINCGNTIDADLNAALNHSVNLPPLKRGQINNENGEFWLEKIIKVGSQLGVDLVPNDPEPLVYAL